MRCCIIAAAKERQNAVPEPRQTPQQLKPPRKGPSSTMRSKSAWAPAKLCVGRFAIRKLGGSGAVGCAGSPTIRTFFPSGGPFQKGSLLIGVAGGCRRRKLRCSAVRFGERFGGGPAGRHGRRRPAAYARLDGRPIKATSPPSSLEPLEQAPCLEWPEPIRSSSK